MAVPTVVGGAACRGGTRVRETHPHRGGGVAGGPRTTGGGHRHQERGTRPPRGLWRVETGRGRVPLVETAGVSPPPPHGGQQQRRRYAPHDGDGVSGGPPPLCTVPVVLRPAPARPPRGAAAHVCRTSAPSGGSSANKDSTEGAVSQSRGARVPATGPRATVIDASRSICSSRRVRVILTGAFLRH